jgi:glucose/arabinose dehydrogenase
MKHSLVFVGWFALTSFASNALTFPTQTQNAFPLLGSFSFPVDLQNAGDGTNRLFVVEKDGKIWVFDASPNVTSKTLFLDITAKVRNDGSNGLLALAFHPDYENNGTFFVMYNTITPNLSRWSRFQVGVQDPNVADPLSEVILFEIPQTNTCHKGCALAFGPDGYLYTSIGDDCQGWPGQDLTTKMGKMLRLDVDHVSPPLEYAIPPDNPLVGNPNGWPEEIYAWGFRNPWRFSFDADNGRIFMGDVGESKWEEVNIIFKGRNYGWDNIEGNQCYPNPALCDTIGMNAVLPIHQYAHLHEIGNAIIGGYVYRGHTLPALWGKYVYADVGDGAFALWHDGTSWTSQLIEAHNPSRQYTTFGVDETDELYVVSIFGGIYRFIDTASDVGTSPPALSLDAHPNPFQSSTTFRFVEPVDGEGEIHIYNVRARRVATLPIAAQAGTVTWDGLGDQGQELASGVYFAQLHVDGRKVASRQVVIVR